MREFDPKRMDRLLSPERYQSQNPEKVLEALGVQAGMTVADIGAGPGFYTLPAAKLVGPQGKLIALDIEPRMLERLHQRADEAGLCNVETLVAQEQRLPLADAVVDVVLVANVLHEVRDKAVLLREVERVLRPGGTLGVVEWRKVEMEQGPSFAIRISREQLVEALQATGFTEIEPFPVGPYHYGLKASKRAAAPVS